jgi:oxygen-dependent protoporphyrinogen oxidase
VIIVGGGIAGLTAAYELHRRGVPCLVLERSSEAGGVIRTEEVGGFVIDGGPDALLVQKPDGVGLCRELGLGERLVPTQPPRVAYVQRGGKLHPLPPSSVLGIPTRFGPFVRSGLFSWPAKVRMAAELFVPAQRDGESDESIGSFIERRFGREAVTYLAEPLLAGIHAGDVDRLSLVALFPRLKEAERRHGSLIRAFRRQRAEAPSDGVFRSLPGGLAELVRALVAALPSEAVRTGVPVVRVRQRARGTGAANAFVVDSETASYECKAVVLATPAYATAALVGDEDTRLAKLCAGVPYVSLATVALPFPREAVTHPLKGSGYVVPRTERNGVLAVTWLSSKWPHRAPDGTVLLRAFVGGARDPDVLRLTDAELVERSLAAIRPVLGVHGEPLFTRVFRFDRASAQHEVGHAARLAEIERLLAGRPGLFVTGSGFRGVGIPDCVADARATAARAVGWIEGETRGT